MLHSETEAKKYVIWIVCRETVRSSFPLKRVNPSATLLFFKQVSNNAKRFYSNKNRRFFCVGRTVCTAINRGKPRQFQFYYPTNTYFIRMTPSLSRSIFFHFHLTKLESSSNLFIDQFFTITYQNTCSYNWLQKIEWIIPYYLRMFNFLKLLLKN